MNITLNRELIIQIINTLKSMDVRGYDSMSMVVGLVNLFESILAQAEAKQQETPEGAE